MDPRLPIAVILLVALAGCTSPSESAFQCAAESLQGAGPGMQVVRLSSNIDVDACVTVSTGAHSAVFLMPAYVESEAAALIPCQGPESPDITAHTLDGELLFHTRVAGEYNCDSSPRVVLELSSNAGSYTGTMLLSTRR